MEVINRQTLPTARWETLRTIRAGGYVGVTEDMLIDVLSAEFRSVELMCVRNILDYLEERRLITITRSEVDPWRAKVARFGYDVADYAVPCDPGIARPPRV